MLTPEEIQKEKEYLNKVITVLKQEIAKFDEKVKFYAENIQEQMSYAWDKTNRLSDTEFVYALANIQKRSVYAGNANKKVRSYTQMLDSAYFARIDFEDYESKEIWPIYIGIASLSQDNEFYVYDWRAPISSMFYNYEVGEASYEISTGEKISGKITLKRQYKIVGEEIKEVFDTDLQIIDNVLKGILSSNASHKMRNIVTTIQKEQNQIIRKNNADIFVVQGPAGSGKTSIAMHKIAYLLYSERDKITNSNVMILSPNDIFNNYISDVLPEIGEDNVVQGTFIEFAKSYINEFNFATKIEDAYEIIYASKEKRNLKKLEEIKFKYDPAYINIIDEFIRQNKFEMFDLDEIKINDQTLISIENMKKIAYTLPASNESVYLEGKRAIEKIYLKAEQISKKHLTLEKLRKQAIDNLSKLKLKVAIFYKKLFSDKNAFISLAENVLATLGRDKNEYNLGNIFDISIKSLNEDRLEFQDITPFMYFKSRIIGISPNKTLKYLLIDEAQDYSLAQYKIFAMLFKNSNITLLGDLNQSILPFNKHDDYKNIINSLSSRKQSPVVEEFNLSKTYRSTYEINEFAKKVISENNNYSQIERHGDDVAIIQQSTFNPVPILDEAVKLKQKYNTVAIICKNNEEILYYKKQFETYEQSRKFRIVTKNDNVFVEDKIMIIPSYLSKGLEFDAVIISNANADYYDIEEKNLLYVVLTRALHKLEVYYSGEITRLISL